VSTTKPDDCQGLVSGALTIPERKVHHAATAPVFGHHALAAEYDALTPVVLKGMITKMKWVNPHVFEGNKCGGLGSQGGAKGSVRAQAVERVGASVADRRQGIRD